MHQEKEAKEVELKINCRDIICVQVCAAPVPCGTVPPAARRFSRGWIQSPLHWIGPTGMQESRTGRCPTLAAPHVKWL